MDCKSQCTDSAHLALKRGIGFHQPGHDLCKQKPSFRNRAVTIYWGFLLWPTNVSVSFTCINLLLLICKVSCTVVISNHVKCILRCEILPQKYLVRKPLFSFTKKPYYIVKYSDTTASNARLTFASKKFCQKTFSCSFTHHKHILNTCRPNTFMQRLFQKWTDKYR